jgi:hypothetical protein
VKSFESIVNELKKKRVVRNGKIVKKIVCPAGKIVKGGKCVTQTAKDKITRKKAAKKAVRSKRGKSYASSKIQRKKSNRKGKNL